MSTQFILKVASLIGSNDSSINPVKSRFSIQFPSIPDEMLRIDFHGVLEAASVQSVRFPEITRESAVYIYRSRSAV